MVSKSRTIDDDIVSIDVGVFINAIDKLNHGQQQHRSRTHNARFLARI